MIIFRVLLSLFTNIKPTTVPATASTTITAIIMVTVTVLCLVTSCSPVNIHHFVWHIRCHRRENLTSLRYVIVVPETWGSRASAINNKKYASKYQYMKSVSIVLSTGRLAPKRKIYFIVIIILIYHRHKTIDSINLLGS
jgi:hypothetical protein